MKDLQDARHAFGVLVWVKQRKLELEDMEKAARAEIEAVLGDEEAGMLDGRKVITFRRQEQRRIDIAMLRELHPDIAEECTVIANVRSLRTVTE